MTTFELTSYARCAMTKFHHLSSIRFTFDASRYPWASVPVPFSPGVTLPAAPRIGWCLGSVAVG